MASQRRGSRAHSVSENVPVSPSSSKQSHKHKHKHNREHKPPTPRPQSSSPSHLDQQAGRGPVFARHHPPPSPAAVEPEHRSFLELDENLQQQQQQHSNYRDSFASIVEDPFFQKYDDHNAQDELHGPLPPSVPAAGAWPPPRRDSLTTRTTKATTDIGTDAMMDTISIAVIGADGVGKSSVIQRALRLPRPPGMMATSVRIDIDGTTLLVTLIEFVLDLIDVETDRPIRWPKQVNGHILPRIDGALVLYDVMNRDSIKELPPCMALAASAVPSVLVATKCDNPESLWQINPVALVGIFPTAVGDFKTSANVPGSTRDCLNAAIRAAMASRRGKVTRRLVSLHFSPSLAGGAGGGASGAASISPSGWIHPKDPSDPKSATAEAGAGSTDPPEISTGSGSRRRAASSAAHLDAPDIRNNGRPLSQHSKHSRASSDLSLLRGVPPHNSSSSATGSTSDGFPSYRISSRSPRVDFTPGSPHLGLGLGLGSGFGGGAAAEMADDNGGMSVASMLRTHGGVRLDNVIGGEAFLDVDESGSDSFRNSDDIPILQRGDELYLDNRQARSAGVGFDELVDRLVAPRMSRADNNFADIFLCLYRKFAAPSDLFAALAARLERARDDRSTQYLSQIATQLRVIEVVAKWVSLYPGDFGRAATRRQLEDVISRLSSEPIFTAASHQLRWHLEHNVADDDDTGWAVADEPDQEAVDRASRSQSQSHSLRSKESSTRGGAANAGLNDSMSSLHLEDTGGTGTTGSSGGAAVFHQHQQHQQRPSGDTDGAAGGAGGWTAASGGRAGAGTGPAPGGGSTAQFQFHSVEDYEQEAATMVPTATLPLNKIRYHIFLDKDTDDIADEITRIDWVMFSSIRIRDLVRHVSLPADQRERCRSLENVNRMIAHFNHVAQWVANMILIRDKPKHRAPCLEKFMLIALRLRVVNNYNSLAAVLAGINGAAVHRLAQTRALVSAQTQKRFARLVLLMGTQKSHFAYRLAWENSPLPRIPFLPLHRRDLVSAEEGSRTFVGPQGDRINWKKFEVLGEVLLPLMKSQGTPYPNLRRDDGSRELILDCKMPTDEEEIYQRSVQVEPASGAGESSRRRFPWLAG